MVILCDFTIRKFQRRLATTMKPPPMYVQHHQRNTEADKSRDEDADVEYISDIEDALYRCRVKLSAAHARSRIRARVLTIDSLLPSNVRQNDELASKMNVCSWVNFCKSSYVILSISVVLMLFCARTLILMCKLSLRTITKGYCVCAGA